MYGIIYLRSIYRKNKPNEDKYPYMDPMGYIAVTIIIYQFVAIIFSVTFLPARSSLSARDSSLSILWSQCSDK